MHRRFVRNSGRLYARIISVEKHGDSRRGREHRAVGQRGASTSRFGSGKGIDPEVMPRLFDAFFTIKSKGMGMGLAIVTLDRREPWATRNPDGGATLEFDLPVKLDAESRN
jgi:signal transduction histidine kinase